MYRWASVQNAPLGPWFWTSRRSRLEQILTKSLKKEQAQKMVLPVKCTTPNSIRAKNPRRGLLRIFSANLQRRKWRLFFRFYLLHNGGHRSKSESTGPLWVRPGTAVGGQNNLFPNSVYAMRGSSQVDLC